MASRVTSEAVVEYRSGVPIKAILDRYGISKTQFYRRLNQSNIELRGQRERFDENEWAIIVDRYKDGESISDLASRFQSATITISSGLKERGVHIRDTSEAATEYDEKQIELAISNYGDGDTAAIAGSFCGASESTVLRWLKERGVNTRQQVNYGGQQHFFRHLDSEVACYWFGFLCADGSLTGERYVRTLLSSKDAVHLELLHQQLEYFKPIKIFKRTREWKDRPPKEYEFALSLIGSVEIVADLKRHGLLRVKKGDWRPLEKLDDVQFRHFLRGYFDGDGSISRSRKRKSWSWYVCGTNRRFLSYLGKRMPCVKTVNIYKSGKYKGNIWRLAYGGNQIVPRISKWLYDDAMVFLNRKYLLAQTACNDRLITFRN